MRQKRIITIAACLLGGSFAWGQAPRQGGRPRRIPESPPYWRNADPPLTPAAYGKQHLGLRDYKVTAIPGVIAAGQRWTSVWQQLGDNGDGIVGWPDGGLLFAQNDSSDVVKLDGQGKPSYAYTDTNVGGSLSMNTKGELFIVDRGIHASISEIAPVRKVLADHYRGDPLDCAGVTLNDLSAR